MVKYLWRLSRGRCPFCGQKLISNQTLADYPAELNKRADLLTAGLNRPPQLQNCKRCDRIVFEGESGFVQSLLLIDMELGRRPSKDAAVYRY